MTIWPTPSILYDGTLTVWANPLPKRHMVFERSLTFYTICVWCVTARIYQNFKRCACCFAGHPISEVSVIPITPATPSDVAPPTTPVLTNSSMWDPFALGDQVTVSCRKNNGLFDRKKLGSGTNLQIYTLIYLTSNTLSPRWQSGWRACPVCRRELLAFCFFDEIFGKIFKMKLLSAFQLAVLKLTLRLPWLLFPRAKFFVIE